MPIVLHRAPPETAADTSEDRQRAQPKPLPYAVADDFAIRDKAVPFWTGIKAVLGRPTPRR